MLFLQIEAKLAYIFLHAYEKIRYNSIKHVILSLDWTCLKIISQIENCQWLIQLIIVNGFYLLLTYLRLKYPQHLNNVSVRSQFIIK